MVVVLTSTSTEGLYMDDEIRKIVVELAMPFWNFPKHGSQYAVLLLLPAGKRTHQGREGIHLVPSPGVRDNKSEYTHYDQRLLKHGGTVLVGLNYAVARLSEDKSQHTETLLLSELPRMLNLIHKYGVQPTVLLYTRLTPCKGCTEAIISTFRKMYNSMDQLVITYSFNWDNQDYMNPYINCLQRNRLRSTYIRVMCVAEQYGGARQHQCIENDKINCNEHIKNFSTPSPKKRSRPW